MQDGRPELTVFRIQQEQQHSNDPGHIVVERKRPRNAIVFRLPLKTAPEQQEAVGDDVAPLLGQAWKKPVVRIVFIDGTAVELRYFNKSEKGSLYKISKLVKGERLVGHRTSSSGTEVSLAFVNYPSKQPSCLLRVWDEVKGKKASSIIRANKAKTSEAS